MGRTSRAAYIANTLDNIIKNKIENGELDKDFHIDIAEEKRQEIQTQLDIIAKNTTELKKEKMKSSRYSTNIGVDITGLKRSISYKNISDSALENRAKNIYTALNKLSSIIMDRPIVNYALYGKNKNGEYVRLQYSDETVTELYALSESKKRLVSYQEEVSKILRNAKTESDFNIHLSIFMQTLQTAFEEERAMKKYKDDKSHKTFRPGYAYEVFEAHMQKFDVENPSYLNNIEESPSWQSHGPNFNKKGILAAYFVRARGQERWITGGDVGVTQLKSSAIFSVTSFIQLENSLNALYEIFNNKSTIRLKDLRNLTLFLNDFTNKVGTNIDNELEKALNEAFTKLQKSLTK